MNRIGDVMTRQPWTVQIDEPASSARELLAAHRIHHLPVLDRQALVGIVDEADLATAANLVAATAEDVMTPAHEIDADAPLESVLDAMVTQRWDAVVITQQRAVEGIFTTFDAMRVLRDLMRRRAA